jgi:hypothetical protein
MKNILIFLLAFIVFAGMASASTVTLTGTCYSRTINDTNNYIQFNLTNSGNGTATNFLLVPIIEGAATKNTSFLLPLVAPGSTYSEKIYLSNFTLPGSYAQRFVARYSQGTSTFVTLFPCLVNIGQNSQSLVAVTGIKSNSRQMSVNISNIASYPINVQISVYAPPEFNVTSPNRNITLSSYSNSNESFAFSSPAYTDASFPIVVSLSYINNNIHYASIATTSIKFGSGSSTISSLLGGNLITIGIIGLIAIIIILIVLSILIKKKPAHHAHQNTNE